MSGDYGSTEYIQFSTLSEPQYGAPFGMKVPYKRRMNTFAMFVSLGIPWLVFIVVSAVLAFKVHYKEPWLSWLIVISALLVVAAFGFKAWDGWKQKMHSGAHEPKWYAFVFVCSLLAWLLGLIVGMYIYGKYTEAYYDRSSLSAYGHPNGNGSVEDLLDGGSGGSGAGGGAGGSGSGAGGVGAGVGVGRGVNGYAATGGVDPVTAKGAQMMDAGAVYFAKGSYLDLTKSMYFGTKPTYCVAPITWGAESLVNYDFWAVGTNCCNDLPAYAPGRDIGAGFHCGEFNNPEARAGLREMTDSLQPMYRQAVLQAEAKFNISSPHPLYFTWMEDPINGGGRSGSSSGKGSDFNGANYQKGAGISGPGRAGGLGSVGSGSTGIGSTGEGTWATRYDEGSDTGFFGLWPFFPGDFGFGSGGGINVQYKTGMRIWTMTIWAHGILQFMFVTCAAFSFSKINGHSFAW